MDLKNDVAGLHSETCPASSHGADQAINIKIEEVSYMKAAD
jgi:hypothetical protein